MAITFDAQSNAVGSSRVSPLSWVHTIGAGATKGILMIGIAYYVGVSIDSVTVDRNAATLVATKGTGGGGHPETQIYYYLTGSTTGSVTIAVNWTGNMDSFSLGCAMSYFHVDQTTPILGWGSGENDDNNQYLTVSKDIGSTVGMWTFHTNYWGYPWDTYNGLVSWDSGQIHTWSARAGPANNGAYIGLGCADKNETGNSGVQNYQATMNAYEYGGYLMCMMNPAAAGPTTETEPYNLDTITAFKETKDNSIDVIFEKLGMTKTNSIDSLFKTLGITKDNSIDLLFKKLGLIAGTNVMVNGDFETGDLTDWATNGSPTVTTVNPHSGTYCCDIPNTIWIEQLLSPTISTSTISSFSLWARSDNIALVEVVFTYDDATSDIDNRLLTTDWAQYDFTSIISPSKNLQSIQILAVISDIVVDDISLISSGISIDVILSNTVSPTKTVIYSLDGLLEKLGIIPPYDDAIGWWKLDEIVVGPVVDTMGNNDGTNNGATINQDGKFDKAYSFDGLNNYVSIVDDDSLKPAIMTLCCWIYHTSDVTGDRAWVINKNSYDGRTGYGIGLGPTNSIMLSGGNGTTFDDWNTGVIIPKNEWHFIVFTWDGSTKTLYLDGVYQSQHSIVGPQPNTGSLNFGRFSDYDGQYYEGLIDEIRIYNRILTQNEITVLYNQNTFGSYKIDVLLEEMDLTSPYSIDVLLIKGILCYLDVLFEALDIPKIYSVDTLFGYRRFESYNIDTSIGTRFQTFYYPDVIFKMFLEKSIDISTLFAFRTTKTYSSSVLFKKREVTKTDYISVLFKKNNIPETTSIDTILLQGNPIIPPAYAQPTLHINNPNGDLWCFPISWKETQYCNPAIRPIPLAESEYLDDGAYVLEPRTIEVTFRLSDREKDIFESIYDYASTTGSNYFTNFYLRYNYVDSHHPSSHTQPSQYTWYYIGWITEKQYSFEYSMQDGRYVRWWTVKATIDIENFNGSSAIEPSYSHPFSSAVTLNGHKMVQLLDFSRDDKHPPMIPKWINNPAEVDSYLWNECVLDIDYTDRMSNDEKYLMDLTLLGHTKVNLTDYIHNVIGNVWVSEIEAEFNPENWAKPWKYSLHVQANNSEIVFNTSTIIFTESLGVTVAGVHVGPDNLGTLYIDEVATPISLPSIVPLNVGVHEFYFFVPSVALSPVGTSSGFYQWSISGDACFVHEEGTDDVHTFDRESRAAIFVWGIAFIIPEYIVLPSAPYTIDSYLIGDPCVHSYGQIGIYESGWVYYDLPQYFASTYFTVDTWYEIQFIISPCTGYEFHHWEYSSNIILEDSDSVNDNHFKVTDTNGGYLYAVFAEDFDCLLFTNIDNPCYSPIIHINGTDYGGFFGPLPRHFIRYADTYTGVGTTWSMDCYHKFDHWVATGGVTVDGGAISYSVSPVVVIIASGSLEAVYRQTSCNFTSKHLTDPSDTNKGLFRMYYWDYSFPELWSEVCPDTTSIQWKAGGSGKTFHHWETTGGVLVDGSNYSTNVTAVWSFTDTGTITAVYT